MSGTNEQTPVAGRKPRGHSPVPGGGKPPNTSDAAVTAAAVTVTDDVAAGVECRSPKADVGAIAAHEAATVADQKQQDQAAALARQAAFAANFPQQQKKAANATRPLPPRGDAGELRSVFIHATSPNTCTAVITQLYTKFVNLENVQIDVSTTVNHIDVHVSNLDKFKHLIGRNDWALVNARTTEAPSATGWVEVGSLGRASLKITEVLATQAELLASDWSNANLYAAEAGRVFFIAAGTNANIRHVGPSFLGVAVPTVARFVPLPVVQAISAYPFSFAGFHESFRTTTQRAKGDSITLGNCCCVLATSKTDIVGTGKKGFYNHILGQELNESSPTKPLFGQPSP
jgi:hypothetical protein